MRRLLPSLFVVVGGCIPFAWVAPPMTMEVAAGARVVDEPAAALPMRLVATPFSAEPAVHRRRADAALGWQLVPQLGGSIYHGPILEIAALADVRQRRKLWRVSLGARAHMLTGRDRGWGFGGGAQLKTEWIEFMEGPFAGCSPASSDDDPSGYHANDDGLACAVGYGYGETGLGIFTEAMVVDLGSERLHWVGVGLSARIPASFGAGFVLWDFD